MPGRKPNCKAPLAGGTKCNKAEGHGSDGKDTKHVYTAPVVKERVGLDFSTITVQVANKAAMVAHKRTRGANAERDKDQLAVDKIVNSAYAAWTEAGKPAGWDVDKGYGILVKVPAAAVETLEWRIKRAGTFYDLKIRFGGTIVEDGYAEVCFVASDKPDETSE